LGGGGKEKLETRRQKLEIGKEGRSRSLDLENRNGEMEIGRGRNLKPPIAGRFLTELLK
jgi:hypothetical protein